MPRLFIFFHGLSNLKTLKSLLFTLVFCLSCTTYAVYSEEIVSDPRILKSVVQLGNNEFNCTGFLIDRYSIVTAAHCVEDEDGKKNPSAIFKFGKKGDIIENALPIGFAMSSNTKSLGEDIALVFPYSPDGSSKFQDIVPFEIEKPELITAQDEICVVGIGDSAFIKGAQPLKIRCGLRVGVADGGVMFIDDPKELNQINGPGDSGGPVLKKLSDGQYKVIGIISMGPKEGIVSPFGLGTKATNLTIGPAKDWLNKNGFPLK